MKKLFVLIATLLVVSNLCYAQGKYDVLYLKDGSVIKGNIVSQIYGESVTMKTTEGKTITFKQADIEKMGEEKKSLSQVFDKAVNNIKEKTERDKEEYEPREKGRFNKPSGLYWGIESRFESYDFCPEIAASAIVGYRLLPLLEIGVGAGLSLSDREAWSNYDTDTEFIMVAIPVFAHIGSHLLRNTAVSPYIGVDTGYLIPIVTTSLGGRNPTASEVAFVSGFYVDPTIGISFNVRKQTRMYIGVGGKILLPFDGFPLGIKLGMTF